jgi:hypothetical protein
MPLVKMIKNLFSDQKQCYFYNRSQEDGIKFVSYSYEKKPELIKKFEDVEKFLNILKSV